PLREPSGLTQAFALVRRRTFRDLGRACGRECRESDTPGCPEPLDVRDEAGEDRDGAKPPTRPEEAVGRERIQQRVGPLLAAADQASAPRDELPLLLDDLAVELDLPQLRAEPVGKISRTQRVDA